MKNDPIAARLAARPERAKCSICSDLILVNRDGHIRRHDRFDSRVADRDGRGRVWCHGSGMPPRE